MEAEMNENLPFVWRKNYHKEGGWQEKLLEIAHERARRYLTRRCDRHEAEKKVKATNTLALTQCANFFAPFLRRKPTM
jgi:hypothetical protein